VDFLLLTHKVNFNLLGKLEAVDVSDRAKDIVRLLIEVRLVVDALDFCLKVWWSVQSEVIAKPDSLSLLIHAAFE